MKKNIILLSLIISFVTLPLSAVTLKLASLFPEGSTWDLTLKEVANEWRTITDGRVNLKIYPGGIAGSEADMVRKMRIGQLDGAVLSPIGMNKIVSDSFVMTLPFFIRTEEELDFVVNEVTPLFDDDFRAKGFEVMVWSKTGWIKCFSNIPVRTPDDLRQIKLAVSPGEDEMTQAFKSLDFNVIPLGTNNMTVGLQSKMVDSFLNVPMGAAAYQWFALAPYMNDLNITPVVGGIVFSQRAWRKVPKKYHSELKAAMKAVATKFYEEAERLNDQSISIMKKNNLTILSITDKEKAQWYNLFKDGYGVIVGPNKPVSDETYILVKEKLDQFRNEQ